VANGPVTAQHFNPVKSGNASTISCA
jgi:hypothetical protein